MMFGVLARHSSRLGQWSLAHQPALLLGKERCLPSSVAELSRFYTTEELKTQNDEHRSPTTRFISPFVRLGVYQPFDNAVLPLGGREEGNPWLGLGAITAANVLVWLGWRAALEVDDEDPKFMLDHFTVSIRSVTEGRPYTLVTSAFSHQDGLHLAGNLFAFWLFGFKLYRIVGSFTHYLSFYMAAGALGSCGHLLFNRSAFKSYRDNPDLKDIDDEAIMKQVDRPSLGASGAVMGIACATACLFPWDKVFIFFKFRPMILPLPGAVLLYIFSDGIGLTDPNSHVSHAAHLSGCLAGFLGASFLWYRNPLRQGPLPLFRIHRRPVL